ncbi:aspartyl/asparaginyl beta-hydroxylase domain-containing protein [Photorhabdus sp. RM96S]|uniref:aspartyl/asparaginyl beta-hydroxylase domain-containing protein n=1 Tax=Photorhabdus sp. RM96S TaxID=3342822 RepID=UPI0036DF99BD
MEVVGQQITRLDKIRGNYVRLFDALKAQGFHQEAKEILTKAVEQGFFFDLMQRPINLIEGLDSTPVHNSQDFPIVEFLESHFDIIREEVVALQNKARQQAFCDVEEPLIDAGRWQEIVFFEAGTRSKKSCELLPKTSSVLDALPLEVKEAGVIMLSMLDPQTHIVPHCGHTNGRLRVHMGISIPNDVVMRVKEEYVTWTEGQCLVIDDSYEHEVWHYGETPRIVLIVDIFHPQLSEADKERLRTKSSTIESRVGEFMEQNHLKVIQQTAQGIRFEPNDYMGKKVARYLAQTNCTMVRLSDGSVEMSSDEVPKADMFL